MLCRADDVAPPNDGAWDVFNKPLALGSAISALPIILGKTHPKQWATKSSHIVIHLKFVRGRADANLGHFFSFDLYPVFEQVLSENTVAQ